MIHLSSALLHTIASLAAEVNPEQPVHEELENEVLEVLREVSLLMADNLKRSALRFPPPEDTNQI
jgi:hypothetical protein